MTDSLVKELKVSFDASFRHEGAAEVRQKMLNAVIETSERGLLHTSSWLFPPFCTLILLSSLVILNCRIAELLNSFELDTSEDLPQIQPPASPISLSYLLAKSYFDLKVMIPHILLFDVSPLSLSPAISPSELRSQTACRG